MRMANCEQSRMTFHVVPLARRGEAFQAPLLTIGKPRDSLDTLAEATAWLHTFLGRLIGVKPMLGGKPLQASHLPTDEHTSFTW